MIAITFYANNSVTVVEEGEVEDDGGNWRQQSHSCILQIATTNPHGVAAKTWSWSLLLIKLKVTHRNRVAALLLYY